MSEFEKTKEQDVTVVNKRRNFLKKSATGAVIASLPAKSVWGTCSVSGAMSGNLSTSADNKTCTLPDLNNGCNPQKWRKCKDHCDDMFVKLKRKKNRYGEYSHQYKNAKKEYLRHIDNAKKHALHLPRELVTSTYSCGEALNSGDGNIFEHLGAVYLNAYFGFYPGYMGETQAQELSEQVFLYLYTQSKLNSMASSRTRTFSASSMDSMSDSGSVSIYELGYSDDGSTYWEPNA